MLMKMKKLWNIQDKTKLSYLEKLVTNLLHDKDKDVSELAEKAILQMELLRPYFPTVYFRYEFLWSLHTNVFTE